MTIIAEIVIRLLILLSHLATSAARQDGLVRDRTAECLLFFQPSLGNRIAHDIGSAL